MSVKHLLDKSIKSSKCLRCLFFLFLLVVSFSLMTPYFLSLSNVDNILAASSVTGLLALGMTFVIASGGIDLSVASVMALSGTATAVLLQYMELGAPIALFSAAVIGAVCGICSGGLIVFTRAPSFIITLGILSVARALAFIISDGMPVYGLPEFVTILGQARVFGVSIPVVIFLFASLVAFVALHKTRFGQHVLIFGDNPYAAQAFGIKTGLLQIIIYLVSGLFAGVAGFVFMARTNAGDPTAGQNYELVAITAVILGGNKLFGGQASIIGTLLGVLSLGVLQNGLNLLAVSSFYQILFIGMVLIGAACFERLGN